MHLKEGKPRTTRELGEIAENYVEAHATPSRTSHLALIRGNTGTVVCRTIRVVATNVEEPATLRISVSSQTVAIPGPQRVPQPPNQRQQGQTQQQRHTLRCFLCNKPGHGARNCMTKPIAAAELCTPDEVSDEAEEEPAVFAFQFLRPAQLNRYNSPASPCRRHNLVNCAKCLKCREHYKIDCDECKFPPGPTHNCHDLIDICQDCGQHYPVIADACQLRDRCQEMPVVEGTVEVESVNVLRDTGCSTVVVRRSLVPDDKLSRQKALCILIDGTIHRIRRAKLTLRPSKCEIGETTVSFVGHTLNEGVMSLRQDLG